jgi:hypothetical protein
MSSQVVLPFATDARVAHALYRRAERPRNWDDSPHLSRLDAGNLLREAGDLLGVPWLAVALRTVLRTLGPVALASVASWDVATVPLEVRRSARYRGERRLRLFARLLARAVVDNEFPTIGTRSRGDDRFGPNVATGSCRSARDNEGPTSALPGTGTSASPCSPATGRNPSRAAELASVGAEASAPGAQHRPQPPWAGAARSESGAAEDFSAPGRGGGFPPPVTAAVARESGVEVAFSSLRDEPVIIGDEHAEWVDGALDDEHCAEASGNTEAR